ncbi:hypothetical protein O7635_13565 [Asanoa sp. WMMD1127]|uniref:hypothetical protein n=1 Tax=Asanoa sp. WMMD1127 TaxID=3016107 RepID=UPI0024167A2A|nr:hypothetical protein [Asanoa sp. WMMD1127]MDG4822878.1 hypothetical protein [Asanoa sp. WMMD1127]
MKPPAGRATRAASADPRPRPASTWPVVLPALLVLGATTALLVAGHPLQDALLWAAGLALVGNQVARRIIRDSGPAPTVVVGSAIAVFGAVLVLLGYGLAEAALGAGLAGLVAGEVAGRLSTADARRTEV